MEPVPAEVPASRAERYARFVVWLAPVIGVAVLAVSLWFYVSTFGQDRSLDQNVWAAFGNYIGGVAGPLLNLLTIVLLVFTLQVQRDELRLSREELRRSTKALETQAKQFADKNVKDDLFNRAEAVFQEVLRLRSKKLNVPDASRSEEEVAVAAAAGIAYTVGPMTTNRSWDDIMERASPPYASIFKGKYFKRRDENDERYHHLEYALKPLIASLDELANYLDEIDGLSGSKSATDFYRRRLQDTVYSLDEWGYIPVGFAARFYPRPKA